ncbi:amidase family protein [Alkalilimnicola ehrlichii]|uniref:amidase family protein n=1 Tax=Alkalilimnicola ehrlichii TaxID=351052 RepID=UPI001C6E9B53|nr:amidase family protein [Alkalilimnicola ehrlichii]
MGALLERIRAYNGAINAVVTLAEDSALREARAADEAVRRGEPLGPLHGVPITVKDTFEVAGLRCTAGATEMSHHIPERHADCVQRMTDGGAIVIGKTNVPAYAGDLQTNNKIFGCTRNPHDISRTSGGSSGGSAAALAAGFAPLEIGSDLGGSNLTPSHFCGVFGHRPSTGLTSMRGHIPPAPGHLVTVDMEEAGPLARTADDLELGLRVMGGSDARFIVPQVEKLADFRVGCWFVDSSCPIDSELSQGYSALCKSLVERGARVSEARHELLQLNKILPVYFNLLGSGLTHMLSPIERAEMQLLSWVGPMLPKLLGLTRGAQEYPKGAVQSHRAWGLWNEERERMRRQIASLFDDHDVLLTPVNPVVAIKHDHREPNFLRKLFVNGERRSYVDQFCWIALPTLLGLPATSVPIGKTECGLPFGVLVVGAPGQDLTTIHFARRLEQAGIAGFQRPHGF